MTTGHDLSNNNRGAFPDQTDFVFLKASEAAGYDDTFFEGYVATAKARGIPWGPYHFAHPDVNSPQAEAAWFLRCAQRGPLGWALDLETRAGVNPLAVMGAGRLAAWCETFRNLVEPTLGSSVFYTFRSYASVLFPLIRADWKIWLASAAGSPSYRTYAGRAVDLEQYAQVGGFDVNVAYTSITAGDDGVLDPTDPVVKDIFTNFSFVRGLEEDTATHQSLVKLAAQVAALAAAVAKLPAASTATTSGAVDYDVLATKVADKLAARLAS